MTRTWKAAAAGLLAILMLVATEARASRAGKHDAESAAKAADEDSRGAAGQKAAVDAAGRLRPVTPEEARALVEGVARFVDQSGETLTEQYHPSGAVSIDLDDRFQSVSMARVAADGRVVTRCVTTEAEARRFLAADAKAPAKQVSKGPVAKARPARAAVQTAPAKARPQTTTVAPLEEK